MKKLFLCVFSSIVFIFLSAFPASAEITSDSAGNTVFVTPIFNPEKSFYNGGSPVLDDSVNIPSGFNLIGYSVGNSPYSAFSHVTFYYAPSSAIPVCAYESNDYIYFHASGFFKVVDKVYKSDESMVYESSSTLSNVVNPQKLVLFVPCVDLDGNIIVPDSIPVFDLNGISSSDSFHYSVTNTSGLDSFDFYLFPSSFPVTGGVVTNIISIPTYITEISASEQLAIQDDGFASFVDGLQDTYNTLSSGGLLPSIHYFAECSSVATSHSFSPNSYSLPYVKLGSLSTTSHFGLHSGGQFLDLNAISNSNSGVYAYDNLCIVAVGHKDNRDILARLDFSVSALRNTSVVLPNDIIDSNTYQGGTITDLQELANYIKYLFENSDHNLSVEFHNFTAYLQHIPWKSMIEEGVYFGFSDVIPRLQDIEFDTDFDLPSLMNELSPLLQNTQLSLPDLTGALAPYFNGFDITPTGNFAGFLGKES